MSTSITESVALRLDAVGAVPRAQDLYSGVGTDFYERLVGSDRVEIREVLDLARSAGPVLDLGAGSGRLTVPLVKAGARVTALDISDDMLAHLRLALGDHPGLDCVVADMREFDLDRRYGLVVLGATSITLLDRAGRAQLYGSVRRHLVRGGTFALTVAGGAAAESLTTTRDEEITVPGPTGEEKYVFAQQIESGGTVRIVNWIRVSDMARGRTVPVLTSRLHVLSAEVLAGELTEAGFDEPVVSPVRTAGAEIVLLTTTVAGARNGGIDDPR